MRLLALPLLAALLGADGPVDVSAPPYGAVTGLAVYGGDAIQDALDATPGGTVYVPAGLYRLSRRLVIRKTQSLMGQPAGASFANPTVLAFNDGVAGIEILDDPQTGGGQFTRISDLTVWMLYKQRPLPTDEFGPPRPMPDGISAAVSVRLERVRVTGFKRHGVYIQGQTPRNSANLWRVVDAQVDQCGGDGLRIEGGDANGGLADSVSVTACDGFGFTDWSSLGNTYIACHTRTNKAGAYRIGAGVAGISGVNASTLLSCYSEGDQPTTYLGDMVYWLGGTNASSVAGGQLVLPGNSRLRLQSGGGPVPPLTVMAGPGQTGPTLAVHDRFGNRAAAFGPQGTLGLGTQPGAKYPGDGWPVPPRLDVWALPGGPLAQFSSSAGGLGLLDIDGDGLNLKTIGAGGYKPTLGLKGQRVTIGAGGLQLPALSKAERAALKSPRAGLVVWSAEDNVPICYNGSAWVTFGSK